MRYMLQYSVNKWVFGRRLQCPCQDPDLSRCLVKGVPNYVVLKLYPLTGAVRCG